MNSPRTGGEILVANLVAQGATHVFCVPGESYLAVLDALHDVGDELALVVCRQEGGAAFMAEAFGKLTGRPGIAMVTRGPGASNAAIGIHTAAQDSSPMIVFIGQVGGDFADREAFQEIDYRRMYGSIAKWVAQIDRAERIPEYVARAFRTATAGRPGPVVLALPEDMLTSRANTIDAAPVRAADAVPASADVAAAHAMITGARRPLVLVGGPRWTAAACADLKDYVARNALPVACGFRSQDLFDNRDPHYAGDVGIGVNPKLAARIRDADVLLVVGERLGEMVTGGYTLIAPPTPAQSLIHVHPGAEEIGRVYQPALGIVAAPGPFLSALNALPAPPRVAGPTASRRRMPTTKRGGRRVPCPASSISGRSSRGSTRGCLTTRSSPTAPATTPPGCTGYSAIAAFARSSRRTRGRWATACPPQSRPRCCIRSGSSCPGTATDAF